MKKSINEILNNWQNDRSDGFVRYYQKSESSIIKNQDFYVLKITTTINVGGNKKKLNREIKFQTFSKGEKRYNPNGDINVLSHKLKELEKNIKVDRENYIDGIFKL